MEFEDFSGQFDGADSFLIAWDEAVEDIGYLTEACGNGHTQEIAEVAKMHIDDMRMWSSEIQKSIAAYISELTAKVDMLETAGRLIEGLKNGETQEEAGN